MCFTQNVLEHFQQMSNTIGWASKVSNNPPLLNNSKVDVIVGKENLSVSFQKRGQICLKINMANRGTN